MAVAFKDYYETLELPRSASQEEVKKAFRKLARVWHPDVAVDKKIAEEKFKEINEAYEVLSDPEKRKLFDELGANWQQPAGASPHRSGPGPAYTWSGSNGAEDSFEFDGTGFSDFFETYFAGHHAGFGGPQQRAGASNAGTFAHKGQDVEADILVTLVEALKGAQRRVTLRRPGDLGGGDRTDTYDVHIPAGVHEGKRIRLAGQGGPGTGGAPAGDLYLRVRLSRHPDLTVRDQDLYYDLDLAPWEAVLGGQVTIPTLDGTTSLKVPPGTQHGSRLRLRGLGMLIEPGKRGDLYATVRIQTPATVSDEERELWQQLATKSTFKARSSS